MNTQHTIAMVQFTQPLQQSGFFLFRSVAELPLLLEIYRHITGAFWYLLHPNISHQ